MADVPTEQGDADRGGIRAPVWVSVLVLLGLGAIWLLIA